MPSAAAARRKQIHAAARRQPGDFVRLEAGKLRFSLGTTPADPRIPIEVARDAAAVVRGAAADLAQLLSTVHRTIVPPDDFDRLVMAEGYQSLPMPAPTLGPSGGGLDLRAAARLGAESHPALTGGILCAWMGPGGRGNALTALWIEAMQRAFDEMEAAKGVEETPLVVALALQAELMAAAELARDRLPGPPIDRYLRAALGIGLWVASRTGLARAFRAAGRKEDDPLVLKVEAAVGPAPLVGRGGRLGGATLYGCELSGTLPRSDEWVTRLAAGGDAEAAAGDVAGALLAEPELAGRAAQAVAVARLRDLLLGAVGAAEEAGRGETTGPLRDLFTAPGGLEGALSGEAERRALRRACEERAPLSGEAGQVFGELARALKRFKPRDPAAAFGLALEGAVREYASCAAAVYCDAALERLLAPARRSLTPRTGHETEAGLEAEWEAGRLYRISARPGRILRESQQRPTGHLFADVKDFTRRTELLGPAIMAEFLRTEFYRPILVAAKGHFTGMGHLADRGGVSLNNLLGDAISVSGDIEALVALAGQVRRILEAYAARLEREVSTDAVGRQVEAIERRHAEQRAALRRQAAAAKAAVALTQPASAAQSEALARSALLLAEETQLERGRERALARARGEGLEAGVFLSFGAAPLVVLIEDEVFGQNRVAIADKINESARGTSRSPLGRFRADAELEEERATRRQPGLRHAWSVFVDRPLTVALPAHLERRAIEAARAGDVAEAVRMVSGPLRQALEEAARGRGVEEPGQLYNGGAALSQEALDAFRAVTAGQRVVRELVLSPRDLPESLRDRWFYGTEAQQLVASFHLDSRPAELFRRVGLAALKGLGDVPVWEICSGPAAGVLLQALGPVWFRGG